MAAASTISTMEGRAAARQVVGGADPAEQPVDDAEAGGVGRHIGAGLGEDGDQRVLPEEGRLAGHVGAGDEPQPALRPEVAVIGDEAAGLAFDQRRLDHRVTAADDGKVGGRW